MLKIILATILGGIIYFAWNSISWMVLPWHHQTINQFNDEELVMEVLQENTEKSGMYLLPNNIVSSKNTSALTNVQISDNQARTFIAFQKSDTARAMQDSMKWALINSVITSLLIVTLLSCTVDLGYFSRVFFVVMTGLVGALIGHGSNWIWWGFDSSYTIIMIADVVIGWFFAGLVIAAFIGREPDYQLNN